MKRLVAIGMVLGGVLLSVALILWELSSTVHFVNGLDDAVLVSVDGKSAFTVAAGGRSKSTLFEGQHKIEVRTEKGELVEADELFVGDQSTIVYNVIGAAPLFLMPHVYSRSGSPSPANLPSMQVLAGQRKIARDGIQHLFEEAPKTISMDSKSSAKNVTRLQLDLAPGGWRASVMGLTQEGRFREARSLCEGILRLHPAQMEALYVEARAIGMTDGLDAAYDFVAQAIEAHPDLLDLHVVHLGLAAHAGRTAEARQRVEKLLADHPDLGFADYLRARLAAPSRELEMLERLAREKPDDTLLKEALAVRLFRAGRYEESLALHEALAGGPDYGQYLASHLGCLVALGRVAEAAELAARMLEKSPRIDRADLLRYARIAALPGAQPKKQADAFLSKAGQDAHFTRAWLDIQLARKDLLPTNVTAVASEAAALRLYASLLKGPEKAWREASSAGDQVIVELEPDVALLIAAELERAGDPGTAQRIFPYLEQFSLSLDDLRRIVRGGLDAEDRLRFEPQARAALGFVHARALHAANGSCDPACQRAYEGARKDDLLGGVVKLAMERWNAPEAGREPWMLRLVQRAPSAKND